MKGRHVLAIAVGVVGGFVLSLIVGLVMGAAMVAYYATQGMPMQKIAIQLNFAHLVSSIPFLLASLGGGGFALLVAGFVAGWIARSHQLVTGLILGAVSVVISVPFYFWYPLWYNIVCIVFTIGPAAMGAYAAQVMLKPSGGP